MFQFYRAVGQSDPDGIGEPTSSKAFSTLLLPPSLASSDWMRPLPLLRSYHLSALLHFDSLLRLAQLRHRHSSAKSLGTFVYNQPSVSGGRELGNADEQG